jgi:hypothetical protein
MIDNEAIAFSNTINTINGGLSERSMETACDIARNPGVLRAELAAGGSLVLPE